ncbi:MAG: hypothetical protein M3Y27_30570 [Acidobacteriota bacterium]|nr:hypothetical protein [Acidobacteriota bacterium]
MDKPEVGRSVFANVPHGGSDLRDVSYSVGCEWYWGAQVRRSEAPVDKLKHVAT